MPLLHLPPELFKPIITSVIEEAGVRHSLNYRLVCKTFDNYTLEHHLDAASKLTFANLFEHPEYKQIFDYHGGAILSRIMLRPSLLKTSHTTVVSYVAFLVRHVLKWQRGPPQETTRLRSIYAFNVCDAMMALDTKDFQEYLTGDTNTLGDILTLPDLLPPRCELFPNPLQAAVASDQTAVLDFILKFISTNVKDKRDSGSWDEMRGQARVLSDALRVAIRLHKNQAASVMLDFVSTFRALERSMPLYFQDNLLKHCMRHGNTTFFDKALQYKRTGRYTSKDAVPPKNLQLTEVEMETLFRMGHPSLLRHLLQDGRLDPNCFKQYNNYYSGYAQQPLARKTPLLVALDNNRYDVASVLLAHGANVNETPQPIRINGCHEKGDGKTALWHAADKGDFRRVQFLLSHKADPIVSKKHRHLSPLVAAASWNKCTYLLETAIREGHEAALHPDIWKRYETYMDDRYEFWAWGY